MAGAYLMSFEEVLNYYCIELPGEIYGSKANTNEEKKRDKAVCSSAIKGSNNNY